MARMNNKALIPINVAARKLRVTAAWLRGEAEARRVPALLAGKRWLCNVAAVEAALLARIEPAGGQAPEKGVDHEP